MEQQNQKQNEIVKLMGNLQDEIKKYEEDTMDMLGDLAKEKESDKNRIRKILSVAEKIEYAGKTIADLSRTWVEIIDEKSKLEKTSDISMNEKCESDSTVDKKKIKNKTTWEIADNKIRIQTERDDGSTFSNIVPALTFRTISIKAIEIASKRNYVKTSDVVRELEEEIIRESDYKKTPRVPVHATFRVLVEKNILQIDENNSHKYLLAAESKNKAVSIINEMI